MYSDEHLQGKLSLKDIFKLLSYKREFKKEHPFYFKPDGILIFCGPQGSGKTLSAVKYVNDLKKDYPFATVVSNLHLNGIDYIPYEGITHLVNKIPSNGEFGTIVLIDEIQTEFSSLESKGISPTVLAAICQQRKRRLHIVGTSQLWTRIGKAFREQTSGAVDCSCILGCIQRNRLIDFGACAYDINGNVTQTAYKHQYFWTRNPKLFSLYDTSTVIKRKGFLDVCT